MTTFQLPPLKEKSAYVHRQFERIARRYDLTNDAISLGMHRSWKRRAANELGCLPDGRYLDVCCGTGDLALNIAALLSERANVTGVDFSANMLSVAEDRGSRALGSGRVSCQLEWRQGDAQDLPFATGSFDGALISFGLRNLSDLLAGLKQMRRVVKPRGKVINLDLGDPTIPGFTALFNLYFRHVVPLIGQVLQNDRSAYTYLPESRNTYPKPDELSLLFKEAGLVDVRWQPLALGSVALHVGTVLVKADKVPAELRAEATLSLGRRQSLMVVAGDISGDQHSAKVIAQLMKRLPNLEVWGVGGPELDKLGAQLLFRAEDLSVVGIVAGLSVLSAVTRMKGKLLAQVRKRTPDCILLVDFGGFNVGFADALHRAFPKIPIVYFISPQVWGSRPWRLNVLARSISKALVIFPFEEEMYRQRGIDAVFVGHPLVDRFSGFDKARARESFCTKLGFTLDKPLVGIFPGSRSQEVRNFMPMLIQAISWLHKERPDLQFAMSMTNPRLGELIYEALSRSRNTALIGQVVKMVNNEDNAGLMAASDLLWTKSGTTTLEAAMMTKPMLVFYRGDWVSFLLFLLFKRVKYVSLPNLLAGRMLVPELIQLDCRAEQLVRYTGDWLDVPAARADIIDQLRSVKAYLQKGDFAANAASELEKILSHPGGRKV